MAWKRTTIDMGSILAGSTIHLNFQFIGTAENLTSIPSCGCTAVSWDKETGILSATIRINPIPKHLLQQGNYTIRKTILVSYIEDNTQKSDTLIIKAIAK